MRKGVNVQRCKSGNLSEHLYFSFILQSFLLPIMITKNNNYDYGILYNYIFCRIYYHILLREVCSTFSRYAFSRYAFSRSFGAFCSTFSTPLHIYTFAH